jgi:hypothetical protein
MTMDFVPKMRMVRVGVRRPNQANPVVWDDVKAGVGWCELVCTDRYAK